MYLFILALDVLFALIILKKDVSHLNIFHHEFPYAAFADDTIFFVKDLNSAKKVLNNLKQYLNISGLYPNLEKCKITNIIVLKNVNVALCGIKSVNLVEYYVKILGVYISYNKKIQDNINFWVMVKNYYHCS